MRIEQRAALFAAGALTGISSIACGAETHLNPFEPTVTPTALPYQLPYAYSVGVECVPDGSNVSSKHLRLTTVWSGFTRYEPILTTVGEQGSSQEHVVYDMNLNTVPQGGFTTDLTTGRPSHKETPKDSQRSENTPKNTLVAEDLEQIPLEPGKTYTFEVSHAEPNGGKGPYEYFAQFHTGQRLAKAVVTIPDCK